jgi:acetyl/propionyl-CoA carboxylase alpha subunit
MRQGDAGEGICTLHLHYGGKDHGHGKGPHHSKKTTTGGRGRGGDGGVISEVKVIQASQLHDIYSSSANKNKGSAVTWDLSLSIDGHRLSGTASISQNTVSKTDIIDIWIAGQVGKNKTHYQLTLPHAVYGASADGTGSSNPLILSPMPGKVVKVVVEDGAEVKVGDTIAIIEAMKMEHTVRWIW